jgi:hypothetical protein
LWKDRALMTEHGAAAAVTAAWQVRQHIFTTIAARGVAPDATETAASLGIAPERVAEALDWLSEHRHLVIDADRSVIMAHPFSNVETPFVVESGGRRWWANCAWDTFGILAAVDADGTIEAVYADDGAPARIEVRAGVPEGEGVVHLLLPQREWTEDFFET